MRRGERHAMPAKAMGIKDIGRQSPHSGQAVDGQIQRPVPAVIDADVGQRGEYLGQAVFKLKMFKPKVAAAVIAIAAE